jgi:hypothetical protein
MTAPKSEDRIVAALDAELERRAGRAPNAPIPRLDPEERAEVDALVEVADLLWESADHPAPPLTSDPTAIRLGLVPNPSATGKRTTGEPAEVVR